MKCRKIVSGLLACAMVVTSVFTCDVATVRAADQPTPVITYEFNGTLGNNVKMHGEAFASYTGSASYGTGLDGTENGAVKLGSYGLELPDKNIGSNYTVSLWAKPDGAIVGNSAIVFLGYHNPELWTGVSGEDGANKCKVWFKGESFSHTTIGNVSVPSGGWTMITLTCSNKHVKVYRNGVFVAENDAVGALDGTNQGIYLGVNNWDKLYSGLIDDVYVYNQELSAEQVLDLHNKTMDKVLEKRLNNMEEILVGRNSSSSDVRYDLNLPKTYEGSTVTWKISPAGIISEDGKVKNPAADTEVTLTTTISSGDVSKTKDFTVTVKPADRTEYDTVLAKANQELDNTYVFEDSKASLEETLDNLSLEKGASQTEIDRMILKIKMAMGKLEYLGDYKDPLMTIDDANLSKSLDLKVGATGTAFQVPASIKDMVTVSYSSSNDSVATVDTSGVITAKGAGYANVIATVTAKYDGFAMEYQTLVKVESNAINNVTINVEASAAATTLAKGSTTQISVNATSGAQITYRAKGAVSVDNSGNVKGVKAGTGTVTVKAKLSGKTVSKKLTFNVGDITGTNTVKVKKSITLKVTGLSGKVKWSVNKTKLATISNKGKLKAKKKGKVVVTAKVGDITMKKTITIKKK